MISGQYRTYEKERTLTEAYAYATRPAVGRKKQWTERLTLPLMKETVDAMDAALELGEVRLDLIREAIERELRRRERQKPKDPK